MAAGRDPVDRVIDLVVAVPVSIVAAARQLMPARVARLEARVARDLDLVVRYARRAAPSMPRRAARTVAPPAAPHRRDEAAAMPVAAVAQVSDAAVEASAEPLVELPIEGYDQLSARQIVDRLGALTRPELERIELHEQQHRRRQTILLRIAQLT